MQLQEKDYKNFKCLLGYFVAHLEAYYRIYNNSSYGPGNGKGSAGHKKIRVVFNDLPEEVVSQQIRGYELLKEATNQGKNVMIWSGQSWSNNDAIDCQISAWNKLNALLRISIAIRTDNFKFDNAGIYLHWYGTDINIKVAASNMGQITELQIIDSITKETYKKSDIRKLGLFNNGNVTQELKEFYHVFIQKGILKIMNNQSYNTILTGAPGTGKTYLAKEIAKTITGDNDDSNHPHYEMVQFHPSYDYTDFVEGLRPVKDQKGNIGFERKDGVFKAFCKKALKDWNDMFDKANKGLQGNNIGKNDIDKWINAAYFSDKEIKFDIDNGESLATGGDAEIADNAEIASKIADKLAPKYVFIIDEINRGEMSKIFGELFFSIDPGYRGTKGIIKTQYQNLVDQNDLFKDGFFVPENVYIIGTMNDIDRSVESMDFAMRRRFAFEEVKATSREEMLDDLIPDKTTRDEAIKRMHNVNYRIQTIEGLNEAYHIGPAYFGKIDGNDFKGLWDNHIKGLLYEYLRGMPQAKDLLDSLRRAYDAQDSCVETTAEGELKLDQQKSDFWKNNVLNGQ